MSTAHIPAPTPGPIPVIIVGGFLGAGKTTLVNSLIRQADGLRLAALVNDFGALNIDADLVVGVEGTTVALANGCICCTIRDDLAAACAGLLRQPQRPDAVVVELSGVSEPGPVLSTFLETELRDAFELSCTVVVVDAQGWGGLSGGASELALAQLRTADLIALSKTDLVDRERREAVTKAVRAKVGRAAICPAPNGVLPLASVLDPSVAQPNRPSTVATPTDHGIRAWVWEEDRPLALPRLENLIEAFPPEVLRCKGYVHLEEFPGYRFLLQAVGARSSLQPLGPWDSEQPATRLTVIRGRGPVRDDALRARLSGCVGRMDLSASPVLRLVHRLAPELLQTRVA